MNTRSGRDWATGPVWMRQRRSGKNKPNRVQASHDLVSLLGLEATLFVDETHHYKCLMDWNQKGTLLALAQDEPNSVIVLDVFKRKQLCRVDTGFTSDSVSSVRFMPDSDRQVVTCHITGGLTMIDIVENGKCLLSNHEYSDIAVHPSEPNLIWLVSLNGDIVCFDTRENSECAKCHNEYACSYIAVNPFRSDVLAVGCLEGDTLLIDTRALRSRDPSPYIAMFGPVDPNVPKGCGLRSLAFNSDGSELLVNDDGRQISIFNTYEPWEKFRLFDLSIEPLLSGESYLIDSSTTSKLKPHSYLKEPQEQCPVEMRHELKTLCDDILSEDSTFRGPSNIIDYINESLEEELLRESNPGQPVSSLQDDNIIDYLNVLLDNLARKARRWLPGLVATYPIDEIYHFKFNSSLTDNFSEGVH